MSDDYEHALGGLRGHIVYGEQTAGDTPVEWMQVKVALPYLRDAERALIAERQRADAAEAEVATARALADALRADNERLRAIVEGRSEAPTDAEIDAHAAVGGKWRVRAQWNRRSTRQSVDTVYSLAPQIAALLREQESAHWWATDADDVLCAWPVTPTDHATAHAAHRAAVVARVAAGDLCTHVSADELRALAARKVTP